eukprot:TRINITY_DN2535_c0_g1_i1.p1 TRINITY_DN2535_c0_g1~~TRINITY_DN2535_c0_g1_i1.p1  ORF type:complete len:124 (-),score=59.06 TRINITY_DN2535_c0_g1_i1:11-382(-)
MVRVNIMLCIFFFQAEDGIRDLVRSRGLGDVYKRQDILGLTHLREGAGSSGAARTGPLTTVGQLTVLLGDGAWSTEQGHNSIVHRGTCLLYTSDAADDLLCVDLGGGRIIKKKKNKKIELRRR